MRLPIRFQFMLPLLVVAIASLTAIGIIDARLATQQTRSRIEQQLRGVVNVLTESNYPLTDSVLNQMSRLANAEFVLTDQNGRLLASSNSLDLAGRTPDATTIHRADEVRLGTLVVIDYQPFLHSSIWVPHRTQLTEPSVLHILFSQAEFNAAWRAAFLPPFLVGLATLAAVALVVHLVAGRVSRILAKLGSEVQRLSRGDYSQIKQPALNDETRDLTNSINQTANQLAEYETELRRNERLQTVAMLGAGLAHEMRNAATGCRLALDLHAEECNETLEDESLTVARRQLSLMENRLQQLLHLGRQPENTGKSFLDLTKLVKESVQLIRPAALHAGVRLDCFAPEADVTVQADSEMLNQAIMNLLLNALDAAAKAQASGEGPGMVQVEVNQQGSESELIIADSGCGPNVKQSNDVFQPFVTNKPEGVGLGLAVARRVVEACGGQIAWKRVDGLTKFQVRLPLAPAGVHHG